MAMNVEDDPKVAVGIARRKNEEAVERHPVVSQEECETAIEADGEGEAAHAGRG